MCGFAGIVDPNDALNLRCDVEIKGCDRETYYGGLFVDYA